MRSLVRKKNNVPRTIAWIVVILIVLGMAAVAYKLWRQYGGISGFNQTIVRETNGAPQANPNPKGPDTTEVSRAAYNAWQAADDQPRYFYIPSLDVSVIVQSAGVDPSGALAEPDNIHKVMWDSDSTKPGDKGAAIITGYNTFDGQLGAFSQLDQLKAGDIIKIELGNGKALNYDVKSTETVSADELTLNKLSTPAEGTSYGLNLVVVDGESTAATRLIIYAALR